MQRVTTAVIPVAGIGTRFLPATKAVPKELFPIIDKPVIQYIVEEVRAAGITKVIFILNDDKEAIRRHFTNDSELEAFLQQRNKVQEKEIVRQIQQGVEFHFVRQDAPLGLGHAVMQAESLTGAEPFIVLGGDDIITASVSATQQVIDVYTRHERSVIGVLQVPRDAVSRYGIIDPETELEPGAYAIKDIVEKPNADEAPSQFAVVGRWLLTPAIYTHLKQVTPDASGEIQLTAAIRSLMQTEPVAARVLDGQYWDCGNKVEYAKATIYFATRHPQFGEEIQSFIRQLIS